jgi:hypothetical protein
MISNDGASRYYTSFPNLYARENDASQADPHPIPDHDGPDIFRIRGAACPSELGIAGMAVGIHQNSSAGQIAIVSDRYALADSELTVMTDRRIVANLEQRVIGESSGEGDCDPAIKNNIVAEDDVPRPLDKMHMTICAQPPPVFLTIRLEQWFADEHAQSELNAFARCQEQPKQGFNKDARCRHTE